MLSTAVVGLFQKKSPVFMYINWTLRLCLTSNRHTKEICLELDVYESNLI